MYTLDMNKVMTKLDTDAKREGVVEMTYRQTFIKSEFGCRLRKSIYAPADIVPTRQHCRNRNGKQINLQTIRIQERLDNPSLYKAYRKPILRSKTMTTAQVKRTIDGKQVTLTPTENFIERTGYRIDMVADQLERLSKQRGANFESTKEHISAIETELLELVEKTIEALKTPAGKKAKSNGFAAKLAKV